MQDINETSICPIVHYDVQNNEEKKVEKACFT